MRSGAWRYRRRRCTGPGSSSGMGQGIPPRGSRSDPASNWLRGASVARPAGLGQRVIFRSVARSAAGAPAGEADVAASRRALRFGKDGGYGSTLVSGSSLLGLPGQRGPWVVRVQRIFRRDRSQPKRGASSLACPTGPTRVVHWSARLVPSAEGTDVGGG